MSFTLPVTWNCRMCHHKHTAEQWQQTPVPRHCHACGALAVVPSDNPNFDWASAYAAVRQTTPEPEPEPEDESPIHQLDKRYPVTPVTQSMTPPPEEVKDVKVPETVQVDELGKEVKAPRRRRRT